jgi:putative FmdB family regulatory protein
MWHAPAARLNRPSPVPFYDYVCQACGRRIEVMHGVHATGPERCDACGGKLQRLISRPAIHFKGSGWAKMDARTTSARIASDSGSSSKAEGSDEGSEKESSSPAAAVSSEPAAAPSKSTKGDRKTRSSDPSTSAEEG